MVRLYSPTIGQEPFRTNPLRSPSFWTPHAHTSVHAVDYIAPAIALYSKVFTTDPVITYMLGNLSDEERIAYLPAYFKVLLTAASLNGATFSEVEDWASCTILLPPGKRVDNWRTFWEAGLLGVMWNTGYTGIRVGVVVIS